MALTRPLARHFNLCVIQPTSVTQGHCTVWATSPFERFDRTAAVTAHIEGSALRRTSAQTLSDAGL